MRSFLNKIALAVFTITLGSVGIATNTMAYGGGGMGGGVAEQHSTVTRYPDRSSIWRPFNRDRARDKRGLLKPTASPHR